MKTKLLIILFTLLYINLFGQLQQCEILKQASVSFCNDDYKLTLEKLIEFRQKFPTHYLIEEVNEQIGHLYFLNSDFVNAEREFNKILKDKGSGKSDSEYQSLECETNYDSVGFECMLIVFPEPINHLKNLACIDLSEIYKYQGKFKLSLKYLNLADQKYIYNTNCGNGDDMLDIEMALRYKSIYLLLGDTNLAIKSLVKVIFKYEDGHDEVMRSLGELLALEYTSFQRKNAIDTALNKIQKVIEVYDDKQRTNFIINLFGQDVQIPYLYTDFGKNQSCDYIRDRLKELDFFNN